MATSVKEPELIVNGKHYPLWSQFITKKAEWIGGVLREEDFETEITDITLEPNGAESAFFRICGKDFSCGFDVRYGGISGSGDPNFPSGKGWLSFAGYGGHRFYIKKV